MRIVIRSDDARSAREAQALLAAAGYEAMALPGPYRPAPDGEDIALVCAGSPALARAARATEAPPLAIVAGLTHANPRAFASRDDCDTALALDAPPRLLAAQLDSAIRVAVLEEERIRRAASAEALAIAAPEPAPTPALNLLYVGAPSAFFLPIERAIAELGGALTAAITSHAGFDHLHDRVFDAVVLNGAQEPQQALSLCAALRRNTTLHHMPAMVVTAPGDVATAEAALHRGAAAAAAADQACGAQLGWLLEAIRREQRRRACEGALRALRDLMGDSRTGLFQRRAFDAHLGRLASDHQRSGRALSLVALRVQPAFGARTPTPDAWRRGFGEVASLAASLMREADCGAAISQDTIAMALPASDLGAACGLAERIAAIAECTAFAAGDNGAGPLVFERFAAELQPGESGAGLLARALRGLLGESAVG